MNSNTTPEPKTLISLMFANKGKFSPLAFLQPHWHLFFSSIYSHELSVF